MSDIKYIAPCPDQIVEPKMHILIICRWPVGGIRTFLKYVYGAFPRAKYRLTIVLPETSEFKAVQGNLEHLDVVYEALQGDPNALDFIRRLFKVFRNNHIDVVHSQGFTAGAYVCLLAKLFCVPHLLTLHESFTDQQFKGSRILLRHVAIPFVLRITDKIHTVSEDARNNLLDFFPGLKEKLTKVIAIPNGVQSKKFLIEEKIDWLKKLQLVDNTFIVGYFGRFMPAKGFSFLVGAIEILSRQKLSRNIVVLAFGWGGFIREEQAEIERQGLTPYFRFLPYQENIAKALKGVNVVAMPSQWEAFGLLAAEALVAGIPIIGTDCVGLREVLRNTPATMIPTGDRKALAKAIINEMECSSLKKMRLFQREAAERYDVSNQVGQLQNLICGLIGSNEATVNK